MLNALNFKMSTVHVTLILIIAKITVGEIFNDSNLDEIQEISCNLSTPFHFHSKFEEGSNVFQFVMHGILLPIIALCGFGCNLISIFIFTRSEMTNPINLILTGMTF